jgi:hypothetical protein
MSIADAFWHLLNFLAPPVFIAFFSAVSARLLWRAELRTVGLRRLLAWAALPAIAAALAGLVITGRDGRIVTYAAIVAASSLGLWIAGLRAGRR